MHPSSQPRYHTRLRHSGPCLTVLVVDDNRSLAENLSEILTHEGYACATVNDGDAAIAHLQRERFDLVLTDLQMLPTDGLAVVAAARRMSRDTPIVLMTGFADEDQRRAARDAGATEILDKPFDSQSLVQSVHRWLRSRLDDRPRLSPAWPDHARVRPAIIASLCELRS